MSRPRVFLDVQIGAEPVGRLTIELFTDKTPKTCDNFRALCTGSHQSLSYKKSRFHRIIEEFMCQGGDITNGDGTGGKSIYGDEFEDENLNWREIDTEGLVCMANRGKGTNSSQFFITLASCEHLTGKHTVFGQLVSGQETLKRMENVDVDKEDRPLKDVVISHCGELERKKKNKSPTREADKAKSSHKHSVSRDEESSDGRSRHYHKRRRSMTPESDAISSRSSSPDSRQHREAQRSPPSDHPPQKKRSRRRSDHSMDENIRGRTRHRGGARDASPIEEEESHESSSSRDRQRKRSPSPSRASRRPVGESPHFRRRRSLPNQYERLRQRARHNDEYRLREEEIDRDGGDGRYDGATGGDRSDHWAPRNGSNGRLGSGGNYDGASQGVIKFKGRGAMKYREPMRY